MAKKGKNVSNTTVNITNKSGETVLDNFLIKYWKLLLALVVIILVLVAAALTVSYMRSAEKKRAASDLANANSIAEFQEVVKKYPNQLITGYVRLELGAEYFKKNEYKKAIEIYNQEVKLSKNNNLVSMAKLNEAYVLEAQGKKKEAAESFKKIAANSNTSFQVRCESNFSAGRIYYEMGKKKEAVAFLETCKNEPFMAWPEFAESLLTRIK